MNSALTVTTTGPNVFHVSVLKLPVQLEMFHAKRKVADVPVRTALPVFTAMRVPLVSTTFHLAIDARALQLVLL